MRKRDIQPDIASALRVLRVRSGKSLKQLQDHVGVSPQIMSRWETGVAPVPEGRLLVYLEAIGFSMADLERELVNTSSNATADVIQFAPQADNGFQGLEYLEVSDELMSPWIEPGERAWFRRGQHPTRMGGCVVEMQDGSRRVRIYERGRDGYYFFRQLNPESTETVLHSDVLAIHRVVLRGA